jgi:hypothetical protein
MNAADSEYIAFACPTQLLFDIANTVDVVTGNPLEWYRRGHVARHVGGEDSGLAVRDLARQPVLRCKSPSRLFRNKPAFLRKTLLPEQRT